MKNYKKTVTGSRHRIDPLFDKANAAELISVVCYPEKTAFKILNDSRSERIRNQDKTIPS